jgi:hypothetical protein
MFKIIHFVFLISNLRVRQNELANLVTEKIQFSLVCGKVTFFTITRSNFFLLSIIKTGLLDQPLIYF